MTVSRVAHHNGTEYLCPCGGSLRQISTTMAVWVVSQFGRLADATDAERGPDAMARCLACNEIVDVYAIPRPSLIITEVTP